MRSYTITRREVFQVLQCVSAQHSERFTRYVQVAQRELNGHLMAPPAPARWSARMLAGDCVVCASPYGQPHMCVQCTRYVSLAVQKVWADARIREEWCRVVVHALVEHSVACTCDVREVVHQARTDTAKVAAQSAMWATLGRVYDTRHCAQEVCSEAGTR